MEFSPREILKISKEITEIDDLGFLLKFSEGELQGFEDENKKDLTKKKGTQAMLKRWYNREGSTRAVLVKALNDSEQAILAGKVDKGECGSFHHYFLEQNH